MRIYVTSLSDYNAGRLHGAWIDLEDFNDAEEVIAHIYDTILATSPEAATTGFPAEEWAIHDYEEAPADFGEFEGLAYLMDIQSQISRIDADFEAIAAYCDHFGVDTLDRFEDRYNGDWESEEDFAADLIDSCGYLKEIPENLRGYFDYEKFSRDLFMCDYIFLDGHVFSQY